MAEPPPRRPGTSNTPLGDRLDEARAHWQQAQTRRSDKCAHPSTALFRRIIADGSTQIYTGCTVCLADLGGGRVLAHRKVADREQLPVGRDDRYVNPPCQVCGAFGTQLHHWAPKEVFGPLEADHWPTSFLCVRCHSEWHKRIADHYADTGRPF